MKNFVKKVSDVRSYLPKVTIWLLIFAASFAFTAGAAMALDTSVSHHGVGIAAFTFGIILTFGWIVDGTLKGFFKAFRDWRREESINFIIIVVYAILAFTSLLITVTALGLH